MNAELPFKNDECIMSGTDTYCIVKSYSDSNEIPGLINETIRQMCINNLNFKKFVDYSKKVRSSCFNSNLEIKSNFQDCTNEIFINEISPEDRESLMRCMKFGSTENEIMLQNNYEETKYFLINYSPLIFINGFYYKGNFDDTSHLFETICNTFEDTPLVCNSLDAFMMSDDMNYAKLIVFMSVVFFTCIILMMTSIMVFYVVYKRRMRKRMHAELNDKINKALMNHKESSDRSSCKRLENTSTTQGNTTQSIN